MTNLVCIGCPRGCHLVVDEDNDYAVSGNNCKIGAEYGKNELTNPTRVLTTTVNIEGAIHNRLPVKSNGALPKDKLLEASKSLKDIISICLYNIFEAIKLGDVIIPNILETGVDIIACKNM